MAVRKLKAKYTMKKIILLIPIALCITGCLNPTLCGTEESIGKNGLAPEHIDYFKDKPTRSVAEAHGTILPLVHAREHLQKQPDGFCYIVNASLLGGLLLEVESVRHFDKEGKLNGDKDRSASMNMLSGLLFEIDIDRDNKNFTGSVNKSFLLKAFGSTQEVGGNKYYTVLWMPIKISNKATEPVMTTPVD